MAAKAPPNKAENAESRLTHVKTYLVCSVLVYDKKK